MAGHLSLLHRDMHDFMQTRAVASSINVRHATLHVVIGDDPLVFKLDTQLFEAERDDVWPPAKCIEDLLRLHAHFLAIVFKRDFLVSAGLASIEQFGSGV